MVMTDEKRVEGGMESEGNRRSSSSTSVVGGGGAKAKWSRKQQNESEGFHQFKMPLHYPRYTQAEYETMPEWRLDCLLKEYGLPITGDLQQKRNFAIGAFLWPHSH